MKTIIIIIAIALILLLALIWILRFRQGKKTIIRAFRKGNVIVTGHKGHGKDLLFSYVINKRENAKKPEYCYASQKYTEATEIKMPADFNIYPNTYENFLNNKINIVKKTLEEKKDYYLSDAGLYLPSTYQGELIKKYPSLPLFYATQRHLLDSNFHINVQNIERLWDKLREQADYYIECCTCMKIPFTKTFIQKMIYYERYNAAKERVRPFVVDRNIIRKDKTQKALKKDFESKYGLVKYVYILNKLPETHYDTREFHKKIYGQEAPIKAKKKRLKRFHHREDKTE